MELVDAGVPNLWDTSRMGVLKACDEVSWMKMERKCKGYTWWWNEEVKEEVPATKEAHKAMCQNSSGENKACDEVWGMKMERRRKENTWWWNEEVKAIPGTKEAHKAMCQNSTEENKWRYKSLKNKAKKAVSKAMRENAE